MLTLKQLYVLKLKFFTTKILLTAIFIFSCCCCFSQKYWINKPLIKTNVINLFMKGPSLAVDIPVGKSLSIMPSAQFGQFNWGDIGGLHKYKSIEAELKKHKRDTYFGAYIKHVTKEVYSEKKDFIFIPVSYDRSFKGNGFAIGATGGIEIPVIKRFYADFNFQLGGGMFYKMNDKFNYNLPNTNFLDYRIACWVGYRLR